MKQYQQYWDSNPSEWTITESEHFIIRGENEGAELYRKSDGVWISCVGDFYGDPVAGIIDWNEKFCVTVGCGVIVYYLAEPFHTYVYDEKCPQWYEFGRGPKNIDWMDAVVQISDDEIELTDTDGNKRVIRVEGI